MGRTDVEAEDRVGVLEGVFAARVVVVVVVVEALAEEVLGLIAGLGPKSCIWVRRCLRDSGGGAAPRRWWGSRRRTSRLLGRGWGRDQPAVQGRRGRWRTYLLMSSVSGKIMVHS